MQLNQWEKLLYDSGIHKGRHERGQELIGKIKSILSDINESSEAGALLDAVSQIQELLENEKSTNIQCGQAADQCLQAADADRNRRDLDRSRFTAAAIEGIIRATVSNRG